MSILLAWWRSKQCYGIFGEAAYMRLSEPIAIGGNFRLGDLDSDDMEGLTVWNPSAPAGMTMEVESRSEMAHCHYR